MLEIEVAILIMLLLLSGFFSGVETALMSVSSIKVRSLMRQKKKGAEALNRIKSNPERLLITILVGNNIVNIGSAALATSITTEIFGNIGVGIATGVMTLLILVFGEITPKSYAAQNAVKLSLRVARPIELLSKVLFPIVRSFEALTSVMMKLFGSKKTDSLTEEELKIIVTMGAEQGIIKKQVAGMMESLIEFEKTKVEEIMTPKSEIVMLDGDSTIGDSLDFVVKTPYSRYPVYRKDREKIIGIADVDDILAAVKSGYTRKKIATISEKALFVPEKKEIMSLLSDFENRGNPISIVVDEYGHVMGIVTMDDVLEEIVGDIFDKSKKPHAYIMKLGPNELVVDGRTTMDILGDHIDLGASEKDFDTIAGMILKKIGRIPKKGEEIKLEKFKIKIEDVTSKHIKRVRIIKK
jgi:putative hemolysin